MHETPRGRSGRAQDSVTANRYNCRACSGRNKNDLRNARLSLRARPPASALEAATLKIWEKHGIKQAGFFTTMIGESNQELTYFLAWDSLAEREKKWGAFMTDPDWMKARAESEADGQIVGNIVSQILTPTAFSAVK
jgi:hypothetical protein